jgi:hypothetical protein
VTLQEAELKEKVIKFKITYLKISLEINRAAESRERLPMRIYFHKIENLASSDDDHDDDCALTILADTTCACEKELEQ